MRFDIEKCGYCGACVSVCPNGSLELTENMLIVKDDRCEDCRRCMIICPLGAFVEVEENLKGFQNPENEILGG